MLHQKNHKQRKNLYNVYKAKDCDGCPIRSKCTKSKRGRSVLRSINADWEEDYIRRNALLDNRELLRKRKTVVEHPFGTIKWMMGKLGFHLTSKEKVQIEIDLLSTSYNIKRLLNCDTVTSLIQKVKDFDWVNFLFFFNLFWCPKNGYGGQK